VSDTAVGQFVVTLVATGGVRRKGRTPGDDDQKLARRGIGIGHRDNGGANVELLIPDADLTSFDAFSQLAE
jgi:hypothetical protein